jgi:poly(A) polymerase
MEVKQKPHLHASWIDRDALEIVQKLQNAGFKSYLVGGCVRDLLVGIHPKDYDIATDASPQQVKKKVYNSYIIGKRFRLVLAKRGEQQFEISTFRRESRPEDFLNLEEGDEGPVGDNFFGTPEEDAVRRDFTINALFYDPIKKELIDYVDASKDIENRIIRMIGDPTKRIHEDSIRSLRALRLAHKIGFKLETSLRSAIQANADILGLSLMPRRREEYLKLLRLDNPAYAFLELYDLGLMKVLLPTLNELFENDEQREILLSYFHRWNEFVVNSQDTVEIYTAFLWAYSSSLQKMKGFEEKAEQLLKNELGVFKTEMSGIESIFRLQSKLKDIVTFQKRGPRRQQAFLDHKGIDVALRLVSADYYLTPKEKLYWEMCLHQQTS